MPIPTPPGATSESTEIDGSPAVVLVDNSNAASGAIWEDHKGVVHAVAGLLDKGDLAECRSTDRLRQSARSTRRSPAATWRHDRQVSQPVSPAVLTIELRKQFRTTTALRGLSMTVGRGEVFGFLGPNGAGKTTAVKLLLGLVRPSGGEAMVLGAPAGDRETRRRIGYLPELFRFQSWLTAG